MVQVAQNFQQEEEEFPEKESAPVTPEESASDSEQPIPPEALSPAIPPAVYPTAEPAPAYYVNPCEAAACAVPTCGTFGRHEPFRFFRDGSRLKLHAWAESGIYVNAHGARSQYLPAGGGLEENSGNGPIHAAGLRTTDYNMNQLWGSLTREMDSSNGLDWGFQMDMVYGMTGTWVQSYNDESFDYGWGEGDYGLGIFQLYGELGYKNLSVKYGKFGTPVGWEATPSWDNFFYSHSYTFNIVPTTHTGALAGYQLSDELKLVGGWSGGLETGFANRYNDSSLIAGFELVLTDKANIYYYMTQGHQKDKLLSNGSYRLGNNGLDHKYFIQSLVFEWNATDKLTYALEWVLNNANPTGGTRTSAYGINNHLIYTLNDKWSVGLRAEWLRDNGVLGYADVSGNGENSDYAELTLGLNFNPTENLRIRPEIRYDHSYKNAIFAGGTKKEQLSGGVGLLFGF
jgi:hypothetical protein